ncbi:hypothetical protein C2E23DRAFT_882922 [Lenzites betulinus]|nr:hypothetical protein C2E23DRAFT_882922 [Lenzites betulinus]
MSKSTYHSRLQGVLSAFAKQGRTFLLLQDVIYKICGQFTGSGIQYGPRYREHIISAVKREVRARRVLHDTAPDLECLVLTDSGQRFYNEWGTFPLYDRGDARIRSLTVPKLNQHTRVLRNVVDELQDVFYEFHFGEQNIEVEGVAATVKSLCETVDVLQGQNSELQLELNYLRADRRRLRAQLASQLPSNAPVVSNGDADCSDDDMELVI